MTQEDDNPGMQMVPYGEPDGSDCPEWAIGAEKASRTDDGKQKAPLRRDVRDALFCDLFSQNRYVLQLYQELHPEDGDATEDDIEIVTLKNIVINGMYNDLGFLVRDKLLVLAEAQTDWSANVAPRMLLYLAETYRRLVASKNLSLHRRAPLPLPTPEFVVLYGGSEKAQETVSLKRDIFISEGVKFSLDMEARVISQPGPQIAGQYVAAAQLVGEFLAAGRKGEIAAIDYVEECIKRGILIEYMQERRKEVIGMLTTDLDWEYDWKLYYDELIRDAQAEAAAKGMAEGRAKGMAEGMAEGRAAGMAEGRAAGMAEGRAAGMAAREASLLSALMENTGMSEAEARSALGLAAE